MSNVPTSRASALLKPTNITSCLAVPLRLRCLVVFLRQPSATCHPVVLGQCMCVCLQYGCAAVLHVLLVTNTAAGIIVYQCPQTRYVVLQARRISLMSYNMHIASLQNSHGYASPCRANIIQHRNRTSKKHKPNTGKLEPLKSGLIWRFVPASKWGKAKVSCPRGRTPPDEVR